MTVFKCKMCGGTLEFTPGNTIAVCDSCGTKQTLPKLDDDRRANLYNRANHFRRNNEFDKAEGIYEQILNEDNTDAEAYWSLVLCHYGIEYVEDPATHHRVPTINRTQFTSIFDDANYKSALQYGDAAQIEVYEAEAVAINEIQKDILSVSQREEPFDVFICYKETDEHGRRTQDSVLANDLYHELTREGFKVFFSRITLENKLGTAYEPYIFAALNSAKVMVVIGTKPEYFNAVWVKNEWSRYLALMKNGARKILIPAYRDMNPYDLPEEFSHLQAQDMGKLGFMQDLIRGIKKLTESNTPKGVVQENTIVNVQNVNVSSLLKRVFLFLEDGNWKEADSYCERVLDQDPECAEAYLGKLMVELQVRKREALKNCAEPFDNLDYYLKTIRFADGKLKEELFKATKEIRERKEKIRLEGIYKRAITTMRAAESESAYKEAADMFGMILEYEDAEEKKEECLIKSEKCRKDRIYDIAQMIMVEAEDKIDEIEILPEDMIEKTSEIISDYKEAIRGFKMIPGWRDSDNQIYLCEKKIEETKQQREYIEKRVHIAAEKKARRKKLILKCIWIAIFIGLIVFICMIRKLWDKKDNEEKSQEATGMLELTATLIPTPTIILEVSTGMKEMINVRGYKLDDAIQMLKMSSSDYNIISDREEYSAEVPRGYVIDQYPPEHASIAHDGTIELTISAGLKDEYKESNEKSKEVTGIPNPTATPMP